MPTEPIGNIKSAKDGSDQTNRDRSNDGTVVINPTFHKYKFMIPAMPWHDVMCPKCYGAGDIVILRSVSHEMAIDAGEPEMEGQPIEETVTCDLCDGAAKVKEYERKKYESENPDG